MFALKLFAVGLLMTPRVVVGSLKGMGALLFVVALLRQAVKPKGGTLSRGIAMGVVVEDQDVVGLQRHVGRVVHPRGKKWVEKNYQTPRVGHMECLGHNYVMVWAPHMGCALQMDYHVASPRPPR